MTPFDQWMALAFPWISVHGTDYKNLRAAWDAGAKAASGGDVTCPAEGGKVTP